MRLRELLTSNTQPVNEAGVAFIDRCRACVAKIRSLAAPEEQQIIDNVKVELTGANDPDKIYSYVRSQRVVVDQEEFADAPIEVLLWLIGHELAHIIKQHNSDSPQQSQQQELDADTWASQIMGKIGITKIPVFTWLGRRKDQMGRLELDRRYELERDPNNADILKGFSHPTMDQRKQNAAKVGVELSKANTDQIDWLISHMA